MRRSLIQRTEDSHLPARSAALNPTKAKPSLNEQSSVLSPLSSELEKAVARMVRCGHANAWDYPWAAFKAAVDEAEAGAAQ